MSSLTISGGAQSVPLAAQSNGLTGQNAGPGNLYISQSPDVSPTNYDGVIGANGQFDRPPGSTTFVCTDASTTAAITYFTDGTRLNSGVVKTQAINRPVLLYSIVLKSNGVYPGIFGDVFDVDVSNFTAVTLYVNASGVANLDPNRSWFTDIALIQYNGDKYTSEVGVRTDRCEFLYSHAGTTIGTTINLATASKFKVPVAGNKIRFQMAASFPAPQLGHNLHIDVYGSNDLVTAPEYTHRNEMFSDQGELTALKQWYGGGSVTVGSPARYWLSTINAPMVINLARASTGSTGMFYLNYSYFHGGLEKSAVVLAIAGTTVYVPQQKTMQLGHYPVGMLLQSDAPMSYDLIIEQ